MSRRLFFGVAAIVACNKPAPPPPIADASEASAPIIDAAVNAAPDAARDAGATGFWATCEGPIAELTSGKSIGHTSVVFKLEFANRKKAVFKPHSKKGPNRYKGEIAAYRLARFLNLGHVVAACPILFPKTKVDTALAGHPDAAALFSEQAIVENDAVRGALIDWVENLGFVEFEKEPLASKWKTWLKKGASIEGSESMARETSQLVVFDYVTGNWDRWSGGNVGQDKDKGELLFIDNDGAFFENPPKDALARNKRLLEGMDRFPAPLIERLRTVDETNLREAFGKDGDGKPLLSAKVISAVAARAKEVLEHVDKKVAANGEAETLYFR